MKNKSFIIILLVIVLSSCKREVPLSQEELMAKNLEGTWNLYSYSEIDLNFDTIAILYTLNDNKLFISDIKGDGGIFKRITTHYSILAYFTVRENDVIDLEYKDFGGGKYTLDYDYELEGDKLIMYNFESYAGAVYYRE